MASSTVLTRWTIFRYWIRRRLQYSLVVFLREMKICQHWKSNDQSIHFTCPLARFKSVLSCLNCAARPTLTIITKRSINDHANVTTMLNHLQRIAFHHVNSVRVNINGICISKSSCRAFRGGWALIACTIIDTIFKICSTVLKSKRIRDHNEIFNFPIKV